MTKDEARQIITMLRFLFGDRPQPDFTAPGVLPTWLETLAPYTPGDGMTALNEYRERMEAQLNAGKAIYFPAPIDFGAVVRVIALKHEREDYQRHALDAAIHCDGSRWIENTSNPQGKRPFPELGEGVVPCPTCAPAQYAKALTGDVHSRMETKGVQASPPPCRRATSIEELPVSAERAREYIAECKAIVAAWSPQCPLKAALEKGWTNG